MFRHPNSTPRSSANNDGSGSIKPPKPPERPLVPYMRFSRKMWGKVRSEHPESQLWDIGKVIGQMWRDAPESEKTVFQQEYEIEKAEYEKALKAYHNSAAYQQYLQQKNRAKMAEKNNTVGSVIASSRGRLDTGGVVIQPVEDEDIGDLSSRKVAAVRFERNHRLIADLFNGSIISDTRTIITQNRIDMLKKQAVSLALHQSKLEEELKKLNSVFNEKKRQMETASAEFSVLLKKVCDEKPRIDEAQYNSMVNDWMGRLSAAYEEYKTKQEAIRAKQLSEREQLAGETPILYSLTVGNCSPSPKATTSEEIRDEPGIKQDKEEISIDPPSSLETSVKPENDDAIKEDEIEKQETVDESAKATGNEETVAQPDDQRRSEDKTPTPTECIVSSPT
ncbi:hypothetical protein AB6A40_005688 [Gnathostoma spinigerum]|uniref:HMG box domain-containing protein n=1 Tax=Gnathostoma spinigerum TaxID=75299 RepID=A0ABD6ENU2_9BILA